MSENYPIYGPFEPLPIDQVTYELNEAFPNMSQETYAKMAEAVQASHQARMGIDAVLNDIRTGKIEDGIGRAIIASEWLPNLVNPAIFEPSWQD